VQYHGIDDGIHLEPPADETRVSISLSVGEDGVAEIRLERAEKANAIDLGHAREFAARLEECGNRDDVRAILLSGDGAAFCAGGDIGYIGDESSGPVLEGMAKEMHETIRAMTALPQPWVAAVNGPAAGLGLSLVCLVDIAIAASTATFKVGYTALGLCPDGGCSWTLPRIAGARAAADLILTNRTIDAVEAREMGIVSRVVDPPALRAAARETAAAIARGSLPAHAAVRRLLLGSSTNSLSEQLDLEATEIVRLGAEPDGREGIAAFLGRRPPRFGAAAGSRA
jgi:2-(1,2-epoxy-1,2-dihydrophenyl)acetyl-CoA isomerase